MDIAIDLGGSSAKALSMDPFEVQLKQSEDPQRDVDYLLSFFPDAERVAVTGGRSRMVQAKNLRRVDEIVAIGRGGLHLSHLARAVVVSIGTGTAVVRAGESMAHVGGTAVGGGTLAGLGRLVLGVSDPLELEMLASKGDAGNVDLSVGDVCGGPVGMLPETATASNFARAVDGSRREDVAASLHRLVGQTIGLVSHFASIEGELVFIGQPTTNRLLRNEIETTLGLFGRKAVFPDKREWGTAIGAYIHAFSEV